LMLISGVALLVGAIMRVTGTGAVKPDAAA
jgi:hypothetical protein